MIGESEGHAAWCAVTFEHRYVDRMSMRSHGLQCQDLGMRVLGAWSVGSGEDEERRFGTNQSLLPFCNVNHDIQCSVSTGVDTVDRRHLFLKPDIPPSSFTSVLPSTCPSQNT